MGQILHVGRRQGASKNQTCLYHGLHAVTDYAPMMPAKPEAPPLKARLKDLGDAFPETFRVRLHRAISWLARAERESDDHDAQFVFLWIAFNAAYAREFGHDEPERERLRQFFALLLSLDGEKRLHALLHQHFTGPIRTMLDNKFVFEPFWRALREHDASSRWEEKFAGARKIALTALMSNDTATLLSIVFDRLYVLRNQLIHGEATWNSGVNRAQVKDGTHILLALVSVVIELMLRQPEADFGEILYPVI